MKVKTKKILVPLDGSKNSIRGLDMAIHIARQSQGTITALTVKSVPGSMQYILLDFWILIQ